MSENFDTPKQSSKGSLIASGIIAASFARLVANSASPGSGKAHMTNEPQTTRYPGHRSIARFRKILKDHMTQAIRPHASRMLNRLDILVRSAVERTTLPASINNLQTKIDKLTSDIATLQENLSLVHQQNTLAASPASTKFDHIQTYQQAHQRETDQQLTRMDVKDSEIDILKGMRQVLQDNPNMPVIVEFSPTQIISSGQTPASWLEKIRGFGFQIYEIDDATQKIQHLRNEADLLQASSINLLLVRNLTGTVAKLLPSNDAS